MFIRTIVTAITLSILLLTDMTVAFACVNTYGTRLDGELVEHEGLENAYDLVEGLQRHPERGAWEKRAAELESKSRTTDDFTVRSDLAVALLHLGLYREGLDIVRQIEAEHPGEYIIAANLGTAYELNGQLDSAMLWIAEGMRRNPESHEGTEWLHLRILRARKELARDPNWLQNHTVLGLDFGDGLRPRMPAILIDRADSSESIRDALFYQLHERLAFVPPPDPIVADLLFDYSSLAALTIDAEHGEALAGLAVKYEPGRIDLAKQRLDFYQKLTRQAQPIHAAYENPGAAMLLLMGVGVLFVVVSLMTWRSRRRKRRQVPA